MNSSLDKLADTFSTITPHNLFFGEPSIDYTELKIHLDDLFFARTKQLPWYLYIYIYTYLILRVAKSFMILINEVFSLIVRVWVRVFMCMCVCVKYRRKTIEPAHRFVDSFVLYLYKIYFVYTRQPRMSNNPNNRMLLLGNALRIIIAMHSSDLRWPELTRPLAIVTYTFAMSQPKYAEKFTTLKLNRNLYVHIFRCSNVCRC